MKETPFSIPSFLTWKYWGSDAPVVFISIALMILFVFFVPSAHAQSGNMYRQQGAQVLQNVQSGVVLQVRQVEVEGRRDAAAVGTGIGAVLGGAIASQVGRNANPLGKNLLTIAGASIGGIAGNRVAENAAKVDAVEYLIQINDGRQARLMAVVQPAPGPELVSGDNVFILKEGQSTRLIKAEVAQLQPQTSEHGTVQGYAPAPAPVHVNPWASIQKTGYVAPVRHTF